MHFPIHSAFTLVTQNQGLSNMIIFVRYKSIQSTVNGIILARFHFDWYSGKRIKIIN